MEINKETFLKGLKSQFEASDEDKITFDVLFETLETWDSLTKFSITAFLEDDYDIVVTPEEFKEFKTPNDIILFIEK